MQFRKSSLIQNDIGSNGNIKSKKKTSKQKGDCPDKTKQKDCPDKKKKHPGQNEKKNCPGAKKIVELLFSLPNLNIRITSNKSVYIKLLDCKQKIDETNCPLCKVEVADPDDAV